MRTWALRETPSGDRYLECLPLLEAGLRHAFTLRPAPPALAAKDGAPPRSITAAIGLGAAEVAVPRQVHGAVVARPRSGGGTAPAAADAVVVTGGRGASAVATADCVGALLFAPRRAAFAAVHAGWRGTLAGVLEAALRSLREEAGAAPMEVILAMGPAIGRCCYEVGEDVAAPFRGAFPDDPEGTLFGVRSGRATLDLLEANRRRAAALGVRPERIHAAGICTSCRLDVCPSWRKEESAAGRMWAVAGWPG